MNQAGKTEGGENSGDGTPRLHIAAVLAPVERSAPLRIPAAHLNL
jgi:hypothetical protein